MNLELFPCSGGLASGLKRAGIEIDMAFDKDPDACTSYAKNLGHAPIRMDAVDLLRMVRGGWGLRSVFLLIADPPCTPWSRAGKRQGTADERDMLGTTIELIRHILPLAYLIANVPGLDDSNNWPTVQRAFAPLSKLGYCIRDYFTLDAADYGVPQHRVRPFWWGHLQGPCLAVPEPTHGDPAVLRTGHIPGVRPLKPWVTVRQALGHLSAAEMGRPIRLRKRSQHSPQHGSLPDKPARVVGTSNLSDGNVLVEPTSKHPTLKEDAPSTTIRSGGRGHAAPQLVLERRRGKDNSLRDHEEDRPARTLRASRTDSERVLLTHPRHPLSTPDEPAFTITAKAEQGAQGGSVLALDEWPWNRPATTVTADERLAPPGHHEKSFLSDNRGHGPNAVVLSEKAAAILQGFPEDWFFAGKTKIARWAQIGQAMPPPLAEAVGRSIARWCAEWRAA